MAFFDELKKNISDVSGSVVKTSGTVMKKSGDVLEIQKAKLKKVSLENDRKDLYAELGKLYFDNYAEGDMPKDMAAVCEKITACQHAIDEAAQRVANLKGVLICTNCQAEIDKNVSYCPHCGAEVVHVVEDDEMEEESTVDSVEADDTDEETAAGEADGETTDSEAAEEISGEKEDSEGAE